MANSHKNMNLIQNSINTNNSTKSRKTKSPKPITSPSQSCVNLIESDYDSNKQRQWQQLDTHTANTLQITKKKPQTKLQGKNTSNTKGHSAQMHQENQ